MGLYGHVQCNCIKEGKIKTPPFNLNLIKYENNIYDISEDVDDKTFYSFLKWKENACKHRGLYYVSERVSNISGSNFLWSAKPIDKCINWEKNEFYFPKELEVIKHRLKVKDFYSLEILTRLFEASCETGNSVVWT